MRSLASEVDSRATLVAGRAITRSWRPGILEPHAPGFCRAQLYGLVDEKVRRLRRPSDADRLIDVWLEELHRALVTERLPADPVQPLHT